MRYVALFPPALLLVGLSSMFLAFDFTTAECGTTPQGGTGNFCLTSPLSWLFIVGVVFLIIGTVSLVWLGTGKTLPQPSGAQPQAPQNTA